MPWNSTFPLGSASVKNNRMIGQQNTTYTEVTMGNSIIGTNTNTTKDHFWNVGANEDGRHRFINSPAFTVGGIAANPVIGSGMDGVYFLKTTLGRAEWFHLNAQGSYQVTPSFITGQVTISGNGSGDWKNLVALPANCYGEIFMYKDSNSSICVSGIFSSSSNSIRCYTQRLKLFQTSESYPIEFRNDGAITLTIQARLGESGSSYNGTWNYRITYRAQ